MITPKSQKRIHFSLGLADLIKSANLWPEPELSPDVPPRRSLKMFLTSPDSLEPDLADQIRESPQCQRALDDLQAEQELLNSMPALDKTKPDYFLQRLAAVKNVFSQKDFTPTKTVTVLCEKPAASFGQLWTTRSEVNIWTGKRVARRWTFAPPLALLIGGPLENPRPVDLTAFQAVFCSLAADWPAHRLADDEILITLPGYGEFVAHLWLNHQIADIQLEACLGKVTDRDAEILKVAIGALTKGLRLSNRQRAGLPLNPVLDAETIQRRQELQLKAACLSATLDAQIAMARDFEAIFEQTELKSSVALAMVKNWTSDISRSRSRKVRNCVLAWPGALAEFYEAARHRDSINGLLKFSASPFASPQSRHKSPGPVAHSWLLEWPARDASIHLRGGECFFVFEPKRGKILGAGILEEAGRRAVLKVARRIKFVQSEPQELVLLIPDLITRDSPVAVVDEPSTISHPRKETTKDFLYNLVNEIKDWVRIPEFQEFLTCSMERVTTTSKKVPELEKSFLVPALAVKLVVSPQSDHLTCSFQVLDKDEEVSRVLDGGIIVAANGDVSQPLNQGQTQIPITSVCDGFALLNKDHQTLHLLDAPGKLHKKRRKA
jgi:hypothetical protein